MSKPSFSWKLMACKRVRKNFQWLLLATCVLALAVWIVSSHGWGFGEYGNSETTTTQRDGTGKIIGTIETVTTVSEKTLWDFLGLLGVPVVLLFLGYWLQKQQEKRAQILSERRQRIADKAAKERQELADKEAKERQKIADEAAKERQELADKEAKERQRIADETAKERQELADKEAKERQRIADETAKEEILQTYFDRLSDLLINKNILAIAAKVYSPEGEQTETIPQPTPEERELLDAAIDVIRARTLSILRRFDGDGDRKASVLRFLIETDVISKARLNLANANLSNISVGFAYLKSAHLNSVNLQDAYLSGANLSRADLGSANLTSADLGSANLNSADLRCANLTRADLRGTDLKEAKLSGATLVSTILSSADLIDAELIFANLSCADLRGANLRGANLRHVNFSNADIRDIKWDARTEWPAPEEVAKAENIPEKLKQQLGIPDETK